MSGSEKSGGAVASPGFIALACVGFIASAPAVGQAPTSPPLLPPDEEGTELQGVTVTDTPLDEGSYRVERASSPKLTAPLIDTPRSIVIIPGQVIQDTASVTLVEALRTVPGITLGAGEGGNPLGDRPFIRGFDSQNSTYLDGVRDIGAQSRETFAVEQIEVVKGSNSAMGGRGSAGGTLNLVSKMPKEGDFVQVSGSYGTADYKRVTADVNEQFGIVGVRLNAMWHDQDVAGRDAVFQKRWGVAPSVTIGLDGPTRLTASYYHLDTDELPDSGIPYLYTIGNAPLGNVGSAPARDYTTISGQAVHVPRRAFYGLKDRDFRKTEVDNFTLRGEHEFGSAVTLRNTFRYGRTEQNYIWTQPDDQQGNVFGTSATSTNPGQLGGYVWRRANTRFGYTDGVIDQVDLFGELEIGGIKNNFAASGEIAFEKADRGTYLLATGSTVSPRCAIATIARYYCTLAGAPNPNDPWVNYTSDTATTTTPIVRNAPDTTTITEAATKAASFFDTINFSDAFLVNLGIRYDDFWTKVRLPVAGGVRPELTFDDQVWTYQAGAVFKPTPNGSIYASFATAATPPGSFIGEGQDGNALAAATLALLKTERTKSYEIGTKWDLFGESLSLTLAGFRTETRNARVTDENNSVAYIGERRIKGVEFGFNGNVTDKWSVFGGYTYMDAVITDGGSTIFTVPATGTAPARIIAQPSVNTGKRFPNTPKHSLTAFTTYKLLDVLSIGGGAIYNSKVYGGYADNRAVVGTGAAATVPAPTKVLSRYAPGYWRFDANASWAVADNLTFRLNVQNIANKRYYDRAYAAHYANQAPGRSALLTLDLKY